MNDQIGYRSLVDKWVADKAAQQIEWAALLDALPSVYPGIVRDSAMELGIWNNVQHSKARIQLTRSKAQELWQQRKLSTPHALDGCWWFTDETQGTLSDWARRLSSDGDLVALFGAPTLFHYMQGEMTDREFVLVDRVIGTNCASEQGVEADLLHLRPTLSRSATVAVVDPPWYVPETRAFLSAARANSAPTAKILLSVPPVGTRPDVALEWKELLAWCGGIGLRLIEYLPLSLRYLSPPFEANALRAAGVPSCPVDWRRGDLAVFECFDAPASSWPTVQPIPYASWRDVEIGRVCLRVKLGQKFKQTSPILEEIVPGDVLPSVSRRDERLGGVALWTSGNRVFGSGAPAMLGQILDDLVADRRLGEVARSETGPAPSSSELNEIELTAGRLRRIIEIEERELEVWSRSVDASMVELAS
jgi:hypothetical protein